MFYLDPMFTYSVSWTDLYHAVNIMECDQWLPMTAGVSVVRRKYNELIFQVFFITGCWGYICWSNLLKYVLDCFKSF